jgi:hypothetical protein
VAEKGEIKQYLVSTDMTDRPMFSAQNYTLLKHVVLEKSNPKKRPKFLATGLAFVSYCEGPVYDPFWMTD